MNSTDEPNKKSLRGSCQSCMMPFKKDPKNENRESDIYCSYCYSGGKLCYEGDDLKTFKKLVEQAIRGRGEGKAKAKLYAFMAGFAPRWRRPSKFKSELE